MRQSIGLKALLAILQRKVDPACLLLKSHIETSKRAVRKITLHRLFMARTAASPVGAPDDPAAVAAARTAGVVARTSSAVPRVPRVPRVPV